MPSYVKPIYKFNIPNNNTTNAKYQQKGKCPHQRIKDHKLSYFRSNNEDNFQNTQPCISNHEKEKNTSATSSTTILKEDQCHLKLGHWLNYL